MEGILLLIVFFLGAYLLFASVIREAQINLAVRALHIDEIELGKKLMDSNLKEQTAWLTRKWRERAGLALWKLSVELAKLRRKIDEGLCDPILSQEAVNDARKFAQGIFSGVPDPNIFSLKLKFPRLKGDAEISRIASTLLDTQGELAKLEWIEYTLGLKPGFEWSITIT